MIPRHRSRGRPRRGTKEIFAGLTPRNTNSVLPPASMPWMDHTIVHVQWNNLEPSDGSFTGADWTEIDNALSDPRNLKVRLRIMSGRFAPNWVRNLEGTPVSGGGVDCSTAGGVSVWDPVDSVGGCVPYFWLTNALYWTRYERLMHEVARRYDDHPRFLDVTDSGCSAIYAETFFRAHGDLSSNTRLWNAGLNGTNDIAAHHTSMSIMNSAFQRTRVMLAVNTWDKIVDPAGDADGRMQDWPSARAFSDEWISKMGDRIEFQNNGQSASSNCPGGGDPNVNFFCWLQLVSPSSPTGYQTQSYERLGGTPADVYATLDAALALGACSVELPGFTALPADLDGPTLQAYDQQFKAQAP